MPNEPFFSKVSYWSVAREHGYKDKAGYREGGARARQPHRPTHRANPTHSRAPSRTGQVAQASRGAGNTIVAVGEDTRGKQESGMNLSSEGGAQEILREVLAMAAEERAE